MKLSQEVKQKIIDILDSKEFMSDLYEGLDEQTRIELGQFYTPADICINMIETYKTEVFNNKNILDPCCGSGNLIIAMLIAGADSDKVYGNDYDYRAVRLARKRINRACDILDKPHIQDWQIHRGDATDAFCLTEFGPNYKNKLIEHYYSELPMLSFYTPPVDEMLSWLTNDQKEFLKEVD